MDIKLKNPKANCVYDYNILFNLVLNILKNNNYFIHQISKELNIHERPVRFTIGRLIGKKYIKINISLYGTKRYTITQKGLDYLNSAVV